MLHLEWIFWNYRFPTQFLFRFAEKQGILLVLLRIIVCWNRSTKQHVNADYILELWTSKTIFPPSRWQSKGPQWFCQVWLIVDRLWTRNAKQSVNIHYLYPWRLITYVLDIWIRANTNIRLKLHPAIDELMINSTLERTRSHGGYICMYVLLISKDNEKCTIKARCA